MSETIVISGATGTIGSQTATQLLEAGATVRVGVRSVDKAAGLKARGAEVVAMDLTDLDAVAAALEGAGAMLLVAPFVEDYAGLHRQIAERAKAAGVFLLRISALGADPQAPLSLGKLHGQADAALATSGVAHAIVQPTFFQDNLVKFHLSTIAGEGAFYGASHGGKVSYISSADIAAVASAILQRPEAHQGKTYVLTGGEAFTDDQVGKLLGAATGKTVRYVDLTEDQLAAGLRSAGMDAFMAEALVGLESVKAQGWAEEVSPVVEALLGRKPESLESFLERNADAFR